MAVTKSNLSLLLVEDNSTDRLLIRESLYDHLVEPHELAEACCLSECLDFIRQNHFDAILLDLGLPDSQGESSFLKILSIAPDIPLLVLTGLEDEEAGLSAMRNGAQDYLIKGQCDGCMLARAVRYAVERQSISTELRELADRLQEATDRLTESEARTRDIIEANEDAMLVIDQENRVRFANSSAERMLGQSRSILLNRPFQHSLDTLRSGELEIPVSDGSYRTVEARIGKIVWEEDEAYLATLRDITTRKRNETELILFRTIIDHSYDALEIIDAETGRFVDMNRTGCQRLGYSREEIRRRAVYDVDSNIDKTSWEVMREQIINGELYSYKGAHLTKCGESFPVEVNLSFVELDRPYIVAAVRNVSDRELNEALLHRDAEILSRLRDAIIVAGRDQQVIYWNKEALSLLEMAEADITHTPLDEVFKGHGNGIETIIQAHLDCLRGQSSKFECELPRHNRQDIRWLEINAYPYYVDDEHAIGSIIVLHDNTERHLLEAQLIQSQKMEAIGTLAGGMAHDFNNIMGAMRGFTELAERRTEDTVVREFLRKAIQSSERATSLIDKILTFSRQQPETRQLIRLNDIVNESVELLRASIPSTIAIELELDPDPPSVLANAGQIQQIILNLGTNAMHAMEGSPGVITVKLERVMVKEPMDDESSQPAQISPGDYHCFSVSDTGHGISPEVMRRIFEPFFSTKEPGKGTGLGLAMVHGIMQQHDGTVTAESVPGKGTTFRCYLPVRDDKARNQAMEKLEEMPGKGEHILLVDDEESILYVGKETLRMLGYTVDTCRDARQALTQAIERPYDLVITDQTMPNMNGFDLAQAILQHKPSQKIIISTGYAASLTPATAAKAGIRAVIRKPESMVNLSRILREVLENGGVAEKVP